jgi:hypothetical protein
LLQRREVGRVAFEVRGSKREEASRENARYKKEQLKLERQGNSCDMPRTEGCISA